MILNHEALFPEDKEEEDQEDLDLENIDPDELKVRWCELPNLILNF